MANLSENVLLNCVVWLQYVSMIFFLDQALRDRLVASLSVDEMVRTILAESSIISYDSARKIELVMENVRKNTALLHKRIKAETMSIHQKLKNKSTTIQPHRPKRYTDNIHS